MARGPEAMRNETRERVGAAHLILHSARRETVSIRSLGSPKKKEGGKLIGERRASKLQWTLRTEESRVTRS